MWSAKGWRPRLRGFFGKGAAVVAGCAARPPRDEVGRRGLIVAWSDASACSRPFAILRRMSVGDELREEEQATVLRMTVDERIRLAFALGKRDLVLYAAQSSLDLVSARRELVKRRSAGRPRSCSAAE